MYVNYLDKTIEQWNLKQQQSWRIHQKLDLSTPQRSQYISGIKRHNPESLDIYSPSDKQLEK